MRTITVNQVQRDALQFVRDHGGLPWEQLRTMEALERRDLLRMKNGNGINLISCRLTPAGEAVLGCYADVQIGNGERCGRPIVYMLLRAEHLRECQESEARERGEIL